MAAVESNLAWRMLGFCYDGFEKENMSFILKCHESQIIMFSIGIYNVNRFVCTNKGCVKNDTRRYFVAFV